MQTRTQGSNQRHQLKHQQFMKKGRGILQHQCQQRQWEGPVLEQGLTQQSLPRTEAWLQGPRGMRSGQGDAGSSTQH